MPTWIVASDLSSRSPKVWSTSNTPDEFVAFAVRSSCSIPLFFEPVEAGKDFYVDGGMLCNLPAFVFSNRDNQTLGGRILAFQLTSNVYHKTEWNIRWLVKQLFDTVISGATNIHRKMQDNVSYVQIQTGDVSSTNFSISDQEVKFLLSSGHSAVVDFIRNEHTKLDDSVGRDVARYGNDELFDDLVREMATPGKRLLISCEETRWFWALYPSIANWMFSGAAVDVLVKKGTNTAREHQRKSILRLMGARIVESEHPPLSCFLISRTDDRRNAAFVLNKDETPYAPKAAVYIGSQHRPIIETLQLVIGEFFKQLPEEASPKLQLRSVNPEKIVKLLKNGVSQYSDPNVSIELKDISLDSPSSVRMVVRRVRSFKLRQIQHLVELYRRFDIPFCAPADIYADECYVSTVTPPVFEQWGNELVAVEGNTRVYYLSRNKVEGLQAFVVAGVRDPLPGIPVRIQEALVSTYDLSSDDRIEKFNYDRFRSIEGAARPDTP